MLLENKVALITGSARGTGAGIARVFAREGARVGVNQVKDEGDLDAVVRELGELPAPVTGFHADIADPREVEALVAHVERELGPIDILVNNYAAPIPRARFAESTWDDWQNQFDYTVKAALLCCQAVLPGMRQRRWGRLISVNTVGIHRPALDYHGYTAAKTAMIGFTRNLALEAGPDNVTVNIVSPGLTLTQEVQDRLSADERTRQINRVPLRRIGRVEDTANVALFLASELASFVTGHYIPVCGGQIME